MRQPFHEALLEPAHLMRCALNELGHDAMLVLEHDEQWRPHEEDPETGHVVFGLHGKVADGVRESVGARIREGRRLFIYQTENLLHYQPALAAAEAGEVPRSSFLWDYNARNAARHGGHFVPLAFVREAFDRSRYVDEHNGKPAGVGRFVELRGVEAARGYEGPVDVLFVGSGNERRFELLKACAARGLTVVWAYNVFGEPLERLARRALLHLNLHFHASYLFESARVVPLLSKGSVVLSEPSEDAQAVELLRVTAEGRALVHLAEHYVKSLWARLELRALQIEALEKAPMKNRLELALVAAGVRSPEAAS